MERYLIAIERTDTGYSAYSPDIPGCITTGGSVEETVFNMKEAIGLHLEMLLSDGETLPHPRGIAAVQEAEELSEGGEYFLAYIQVPMPAVV